MEKSEFSWSGAPLLRIAFGNLTHVGVAHHNRAPTQCLSDMPWRDMPASVPRLGASSLSLFFAHLSLFLFFYSLQLQFLLEFIKLLFMCVSAS